MRSKIHRQRAAKWHNQVVCIKTCLEGIDAPRSMSVLNSRMKLLNAWQMLRKYSVMTLQPDHARWQCGGPTLPAIYSAAAKCCMLVNGPLGQTVARPVPGWPDCPTLTNLEAFSRRTHAYPVDAFTHCVSGSALLRHANWSPPVPRGGFPLE